MKQNLTRDARASRRDAKVDRYRSPTMALLVVMGHVCECSLAPIRGLSRCDDKALAALRLCDGALLMSMEANILATEPFERLRVCVPKEVKSHHRVRGEV
jgi:hypothetical protein